MVVDIQGLRHLGNGLSRPECVLAHASGFLITSNDSEGGGISVVSPEGRTHSITARDFSLQLKPNGIALLPDGAVLLAHLGADRGGVYRLEPDGKVHPFLTEVGGAPLPPTNFVARDTKGRVWITVSTRKHPRQLDYRPHAREGFVILVDARGARIVADGLGYANECKLHPDGEHLVVNETFGRRVTEFSIRPDGALSDRRVVAEFGAGTFPDGLAFDAQGGLWITSVVSNRLIRVAPDGTREVVLEDCDVEEVDAVERAFVGNAMSGEHLRGAQQRTLRHLSSLAFGGVDLKTVYLGTLLGTSLPHFTSDIAGSAPPHWHFDITSLTKVDASGPGAVQ